MIKAQAEEEVAEYLATRADLVDEKSVVTLTDEAALDKGKTIFISYCAACHGTQGEGGVGPNMTDNYWIHGGDIKDLFRVVKYGVPEKGMISWKSQLSPVQMQQVSSYILTLVGTNPPNQKEPQGELYEPAAETAPEGEPATEG
jgi:cytochrome c oxidase cbb3-type subunit 3